MTGAEVDFYNSITGNFMVYQDLFETNLLQLFTNPQHLESFSAISVFGFVVNIVAEQTQVYC